MWNLRLEGDMLTFPGGNVYPTATYDVKTGQCLNKPASPFGSARNLFHPREAWDLQESIVAKATLNPPTGTVTLEKGKLTFAPNDAAAQKGYAPWAGAVVGTCRALVCAGDVVLVAYKGNEGPRLAALNLRDGKVMWTQDLPADAVVWGIAVDTAGRVIVTLEDGRVVCYGSAE
jgi:outer membrane protein assembly factor BamB